MRIVQMGMAAAAAMALISGALAQAPATPPTGANPADNLPDRPGKEKIVEACSGCHQPDIVVGQKRDLAGWREIVDQMIARGANVEEADYAAITAYLAEGT